MIEKHEIEKIAKGYIEFFNASDRDKNKDDVFDLYMNLEHLCNADKYSALEVIIHISKISDDIEFLAYVGAGPLEDIIEDDDNLLKRVRYATNIYPNFHHILDSVWFNENQKDLVDKISRFPGRKNNSIIIP